MSGGTCSVLLLRNRTSTRDIDIYCDDAYFSCKTSLQPGEPVPNSVHWPVNWINAEMVAYVLNNEGCERLFQNSVAQGIMMYSSANFKAYAADWRFQLVGKIRRAYDAYLDHEPSPKDLYDAVDILHILNVKDGRNQRSSDMKKWYYYGYRMGPREVEYINERTGRSLGELGSTKKAKDSRW